MNFELTPQRVAVMAGVSTGLALLFWWLRSRECDDEANEGKVTTSRQTVIEVKVPPKAVGAVIGRQGTNIKQLQEKTKTKINFKDDKNRDSEEDRILVIRGTTDGATEAEMQIHKTIAELPVIISEEMQVPASALGRIIGKKGESIRQISRTSQAKVYIDRCESRGKTKDVTITGTRQQIDIAKDLISDKIDEDAKFRAKTAVMEANREQRTKFNAVARPVENGLNSDMSPAAHQRYTVRQWPDSTGYTEVYVSAVANPDHFWVQFVTSMALQLDQVVQDMTLFYSSNNSKTESIQDRAIGDIVAAPFDNDSSWYRAKVMDVDGDKLDLYYVDYGDSGYLQRDRVRTIRQDFLQLPFQAVECCLENIQPKDDSWSDEAVDLFEDLTYSAKWKVLMAKKLGIKDGLPSLELIDTNTPVDIDIGQELVKRGVAKAVYTTT